MWWHYDTAQSLPEAALAPAVVSALKSYRASGGSLLLTTFAGRYLEALNVLVPSGKGPNNVFGDIDVEASDANGFVEMNNDWEISFSKGMKLTPYSPALKPMSRGKPISCKKERIGPTTQRGGFYPVRWLR